MDETNNNLSVQCYCCGYFTLSKRRHFEICDVCFWEDDGVFEPFEESGPNHMTLEEGRKNFLKYGDCEEGFVKNVVKTPESIYRKGDYKIKNPTQK